MCGICQRLRLSAMLLGEWRVVGNKLCQAVRLTVEYCLARYKAFFKSKLAAVMLC